MKPRRRITVLDTTLRDGDQSPGFALSSSAKLKLAAYLERLGVDIIEAGFPASSRAQFEDVRAIASMMENSVVSVMARCIKKDIDCAVRA
ncbi:MAG TPA: 2-isopropylmalate synthase, partial [Spirochaetota bacterium]|nr:2-isopropylmalate synthase [Spirochaetota bacterium]